MNNCPKCTLEILVETPSVGNVPLDVCPNCSGIWFDKGELETLLAKSQGGGAADLRLIDPKAEGHACPCCKTRMSHGGLVNPLLLVDKCEACGGVWLDSRELDLVKKLLGLSGGPSSDVKVERPAPVPEAPTKRDIKSMLIMVVGAVCAIPGLIGLSYEMFLYFSPAEIAPQPPSVGVAAVSFLLLVGGVVVLVREK